MLILLLSPLWLRVSWTVTGIDLERAFATGRGDTPSRTCQFQLDEDEGSRRDFVLACPIAMAAATACSVLPDRWFIPHFAVYAEFSLSAWDAAVERTKVHSPLWPACWLTCPDRSRSSQSHEVRNIWDVYIREVGFVPCEVRENKKPPFNRAHMTIVQSRCRPCGAVPRGRGDPLT